jgi:RNA polymerase sigma factor (sigma-70 family)
MPEQLDDAEILRRLERAMRSVPRPTREVFLAHRLDEIPYRQIAERTGLSVQQVERHMTRAIVAIDRALTRPPLRWWERVLGW